MITFVILNYKSLNDTLACIESIKKIETEKKLTIVVVDNASLTNDEIINLKPYCDDLLLLKENVGFAKGNNQGCLFAENKYEPDYLCVLNSDIVITKENFVDKIYELDNLYHFDVLGPKILPQSSQSNNPFPAYKDLNKVQKQISYTKKLIYIYNSPILRTLLKIYINIKSLFINNDLIKKDDHDVIGEPLHGCALIFSKKYYKKYKDVFYNNTFLFHEEEFLYYRCMHDKLMFVYSPKIELIHKEGQSLNKEYNDNYKKLIFKNKEILKSLLLLEKVMKEGKKI